MLQLARTNAEAHLFMDLRPCSCGVSRFERQSSVAVIEGDLASRYTGACAGCGVERLFEFRIPEEILPPPATGIRFGGSEPSRLLDPGEWLLVADDHARRFPDRALDGDVRHALATAIAALEEVVKFIPVGATEVPETAFRTPLGRQVRDREPGRFRAVRLEAVRDAYAKIIEPPTEREVYQVFNDNNVLVEVTREQLDAQAADGGMLPTHLANAAGSARRRDLIGPLRATLGAPSRLNKLAAARALLVVHDEAAVELLRNRAKDETDAIVAAVFRATALRLEGVEQVRKAFAAGDQDPPLANAFSSVYNGNFDLEPGDVEFLLEALTAYLDNTKPWIADMDRDYWRSDLYVMTRALRRGAALIKDRTLACSVLSRVAKSPADHDTKEIVREILQREV